jgi:hypothetical protein
MKAMLIGGSNSVVAQGYAVNMIATCRKAGIAIDLAYDFSVGNTTTGYGLYRLSNAAEELKSVDLLIVEYALNDEFIYPLNSWDLRHWARLYEGILRCARESNPNIIVFSIILATRTGHFTDRIPAITSGVAYLSDWYGESYIDVNRLASERFGYSVVRNEQFYMPGDSAHYLNPTVTAVIGEMIGEKLAETVARRRTDIPRLLPAPVDPQNYASVTALRATQWAPSLGQTPTPLRNWRFSIDSVDIAHNKVAVTIEDGKLLGVEYACVADTGPLHIEMNGQHFRVGTMVAGVQDGLYKFLICWLPLEFIHGDALLTPCRGQTRTVFSGRAPPNAPLIASTPRNNVQPALEKLTEVNTFYISGLLLSGKCASIEID